MKIKNFFKELKKNKVLFIMLIPTLIYFIINNYIPMVGIYYAFTKYNFRGGLFGSPFVGLDNFKFLIKSGTLWTITRNTLLYNIVFIITGNILEVTVAILISRMITKIYKKTLQAVMFLPYFVSSVILGVLAYNLFGYDHGLINSFLTKIGAEKLDIYNTPKYWPIIITITYLIKNVGYGMIIYLSAITGINEEYYEAAQIDGANIFQQVRFITLPLLKPTFITLLIYSMGGILSGQFDLFYQLVGNNGMLFQVTDIIDTYVYRSLKAYFDVGLGTAAGLYQSFFGLVVVLSVNAIVKRINKDYALF